MDLASATQRQTAKDQTDSPIDRARSVLDVITAEATRSETIGRLTDEAFTALHAAGLFGLLIPRCFGGLEAEAVEAPETLEMLCEADGSAGWIVMACNVGTGTAATYLPDAGAKAVFGEHIPVIAGQGAPRGRAVADGDGDTAAACCTPNICTLAGCFSRMANRAVR
jgi:indole-3-acetate monooxygenase